MINHLSTYHKQVLEYKNWFLSIIFLYPSFNFMFSLHTYSPLINAIITILYIYNYRVDFEETLILKANCLISFHQLTLVNTNSVKSCHTPLHENRELWIELMKVPFIEKLHCILESSGSYRLTITQFCDRFLCS
jgi:hypothetical protein